MIYKINRTVPANTAEGSEDIQHLQISRGTIIQWIIFFPIQAANLCKFKVFYHDVQILPFTRGKWIYGFFTGTPIIEKLRIDVPPYQLDIHAVNTDTIYGHEYNLYVNVEPDKKIDPLKTESWIIEKFRNIFSGV